MQHHDIRRLISNEVRVQFPLLDNVTYLDNASNGLVPLLLKRVFEEQVGLYTSGQQILSEDAALNQLSQFQEARKRIANMIGAAESEICLVESTTHAMQIVSQLVDIRSGDNVLVTDQEFLGSVIPWRVRGEREKFSVRCARTHHGETHVEDILHAMDDRTRVVVLSSVQEVSGFKVDVEAISQAVRSRRVYLVIDAIQHVGAAPFDVSKLNVDFVCCGGHKWLMSPWGIGFLYIRNELCPALSPVTQGYFSVQEPAGGWYEYLSNPSRTVLDSLSVVPGAQKFEVAGTGNGLGAAMLCEVIRWAESMTLDAVYSLIRERTTRLVKELANIPGLMPHPADEHHRAGIVTVRTNLSHEQEKKVVATLLSQSIKVAHRYIRGFGGIRISPHFYNSDAHVDRFVEHLEAAIKDVSKSV